MSNLSDQVFQDAYKSFLSVQAQWYALVEKHSIYHDTDAKDKAHRHVALTADRAIFSQAQHLLAEWQRFAAFANERSAHQKLPIFRDSFMPIPMLIDSPVRVTIAQRPAIATNNFTRENLLGRYDKMIDRLKKVPNTSDLIERFKGERSYFAKQPEASSFRLRKYGFSDSQIEISLNEHEASSRFRHGMHGAVIFSETLTRSDITINIDAPAIYVTRYDRLVAIPCSLFDNASIYSVTDIDREQNHRKQEKTVTKSAVNHRSVFEKRHKEGVAKYRNTAKLEDYIAKSTRKRSMLNWLLENDWTLLERKRSVGDEETLTVGMLRAKYVTQADLDRGMVYPASTMQLREQLRNDGVQLYEDIVAAEQQIPTQSAKAVHYDDNEE